MPHFDFSTIAFQPLGSQALLRPNYGICNIQREKHSILHARLKRHIRKDEGHLTGLACGCALKISAQIRNTIHDLTTHRWLFIKTINQQDKIATIRNNSPFRS